MTKQEVAALIRETFPIFRAHPEKWTRDSLIKRENGVTKFCVMGGATVLSVAKAGLDYKFSDLSYLYNPIPRKLYDAMGGLLGSDIANANNDAFDVEDMITRVEAILKEQGL